MHDICVGSHLSVCMQLHCCNKNVGRRIWYLNTLLWFLFSDLSSFVTSSIPFWDQLSNKCCWDYVPLHIQTVFPHLFNVQQSWNTPTSFSTWTGFSLIFDSDPHLHIKSMHLVYFFQCSKNNSAFIFQFKIKACLKWIGLRKYILNQFYLIVKH